MRKSTAAGFNTHCYRVITTSNGSVNEGRQPRQCFVQRRSGRTKPQPGRIASRRKAAAPMYNQLPTFMICVTRCFLITEFTVRCDGAVTKIFDAEAMRHNWFATLRAVLAYCFRWPSSRVLQTPITHGSGFFQHSPTCAPERYLTWRSPPRAA